MPLQGLNEEQMLTICKSGKYYNPASSHYDGKKTVVCDRCYRVNLDMCIGYEDNDLCLICTKQLIAIDRKKYPKKNKKSGLIRAVEEFLSSVFFLVGFSLKKLFVV